MLETLLFFVFVRFHLGWSYSLCALLFGLSPATLARYWCSEIPILAEHFMQDIEFQATDEAEAVTPAALRKEGKVLVCLDGTYFFFQQVKNFLAQYLMKDGCKACTACESVDCDRRTWSFLALRALLLHTTMTTP